VSLIKRCLYVFLCGADGGGVSNINVNPLLSMRPAKLPTAGGIAVLDSGSDLEAPTSD